MSKSRLRRAALAGITGLALLAAPQAWAQAKTEITLARFYGSCDSTYGASTDPTTARGECGVMTTLVNLFNATNTDNIVVKPQIIESGSYYQQFTARLAARDVPTIAIMHGSEIGDYVRARVLQPIGDDLKAAGIDPADFTDGAREGVTLNNTIYAMPWGTQAWLWEFNVNLFRQAGLVDAKGAPIVPATVDEMIAQAASIREKTGKPYILMATTDDPSPAGRGYLSWLFDQNGTIFPTTNDKPDFRSPAATAVFQAWSKLAQGGAIAKGLDTGGGLRSFMNGEGAVYLTGTWRIDDVLASSEKPGSPLATGFTIRAFPTVFGEQHVWTDTHIWVMPRGGATDPAHKKAAMIFLKFLWDHNFDWARGGGHLPARQSVMAAYGKLPLRQYIMDVPGYSRNFPHDVRHQSGLMTLIGNEVTAIINVGKTTDQAIESAQQRAEQLMRGR